MRKNRAGSSGERVKREAVLYRTVINSLSEEMPLEKD